MRTLELKTDETPARVDTKFVALVDVIDPDSKQPVTLEIRKLETGLMVGLDESWLSSLDNVDQTFSPYDKGVELNIPDNEME